VKKRKPRSVADLVGDGGKGSGLKPEEPKRGENYGRISLHRVSVRRRRDHRQKKRDKYCARAGGLKREKNPTKFAK